MSHAVKDVGDPIESRCTKCRKVTRHVIVSLVEGQAAKVQCRICEGFHNYRPPVRAKPSRGSRPAGGASSPRRRTGRSAVEEEWAAAVESRNPAEAVAYAMSARFQVGDLLGHPSFGLGVVRKVVPPNAVEVLFRDSIRRLRCGG